MLSIFLFSPGIYIEGSCCVHFHSFTINCLNKTIKEKLKNNKATEYEDKHEKKKNMHIFSPLFFWPKIIRVMLCALSQFHSILNKTVQILKTNKAAICEDKYEKKEKKSKHKLYTQLCIIYFFPLAYIEGHVGCTLRKQNN